MQNFKPSNILFQDVYTHSGLMAIPVPARASFCQEIKWDFQLLDIQPFAPACKWGPALVPVSLLLSDSEATRMPDLSLST